MISWVFNLFLMILVIGLKKKIGHLKKINIQQQNLISQQEAHILTMERRDRIENNNLHSDIPINERLRAKGYL